MGGYFSTLGFSEQHKQICYDSLSTQNSFTPDETSIDKIQAEHKEERSLNQLSHENREKLNEFKLEIARKHEKRRQILAEKRKEMDALRQEVLLLREENEKLKNERGECKPENDGNIEIQRLQRENEELKMTIEENNKRLETIGCLTQRNNEMRMQIAEMQKELQELNTEALNFEQEREDYKTHVVALKDVIHVSKHMLQIREAQLKELKEKVESIEKTLAGREMKLLSQDLREEYERQLQNIRNLRQLYEERHRVNKLEKDELMAKLEECKKDLEEEQTKHEESRKRIEELENANSNKYDEIKSLESNLGLSKAECREYQAELAVINQLFSEILLGFNNTQDIDLDKLKTILEENHGLLQNIVVNEISKEVSSALPKVLLDLVTQVNEKQSTDNDEAALVTYNEIESKKPNELETNISSIHQLNSVDEIAENLPKVWRVLIELLSHQQTPTNEISEDPNNTNNPCYKVVETSKGPNLVASVSKTFIRLKDLILEKKSLEKETNKLKQLNTHLESRLQDQEKRLETVTNELTKTWHVVGKLQKQHQLLHTQEKILKYELAQKRKLLVELREQLEYSREKWLQAREKNSSTEQEWKKLRKEFASRRNTLSFENNSCDSGCSDDRESSSSDEEQDEIDLSENIQNPIETNALDSTEAAESVKEVKTNENNLDFSLCSNSTNEVVKTELKTDLVPKTNIEKTDSAVPNKNYLDIDSSPILNNVETTDAVPSTSTPLSDVPSTSDTPVVPKRTLEEVLAARDERLKRLESEATKLVNKVTTTNERSVDISNKLDELHEVYGDASVNSSNQTLPPITEDSLVSGNIGLQRESDNLSTAEESNATEKGLISTRRNSNQE
ncbi:protein Daple [Aethina tumida]|uniref:protein Daple n=1 Tax=Aethina tumida TaxID=116153 RepID=UPI002147EB51|nr:protein Daple [Aethina tumida]XP_019874329.2 protein Daple [Aethina tumida]XP_049819060.1 protein Daple [Aethina tumida]